MKKIIILAAFAAVAAASNATLLFDNATAARSGNANATISGTGSTPNTFMGDGYNLLAGSTDITGFDIYPVNFSTTTFDHIKINLFVWQTVNLGTVSATAPAFSNLLGSYTLTSNVGAFAQNTYIPYESATPGVTPGITLSTPLAISSNQIGLTFNYQGSTDGGVTYNNVNSLTSVIVYGSAAAATVGSDVFNGYYRNANSETNGNFTSLLRTLNQANQSLMVRVYGDAVPEPSTWAALGLGGVALMRRRRSK